MKPSGERQEITHQSYGENGWNNYGNWIDLFGEPCRLAAKDNAIVEAHSYGGQ